MKKLILFLCALIVSIGTAFDSNATLYVVTDVSTSETAVYDNIAEQLWYPDLAHFTNQTYSQQQDSITSLNNSNYFGVDYWHMASYSEMVQLWTHPADDLGQAFEATYAISTPNGQYEDRIGRYDRIYYGPDPAWPMPGYHWEARILKFEDEISFLKFYLNDPDYTVPDEGSDPKLGAWVTASVPEPATFLLLGSGLIGLVGFRRRFKK